MHRRVEPKLLGFVAPTGATNPYLRGLSLPSLVPADFGTPCQNDEVGLNDYRKNTFIVAT